MNQHQRNLLTSSGLLCLVVISLTLHLSKIWTVDVANDFRFLYYTCELFQLEIHILFKVYNTHLNIYLNNKSKRLRCLYFHLIFDNNKRNDHDFCVTICWWIRWIPHAFLLKVYRVVLFIKKNNCERFLPKQAGRVFSVNSWKRLLKECPRWSISNHRREKKITKKMENKIKTNHQLIFIFQLTQHITRSMDK